VTVHFIVTSPIDIKSGHIVSNKPDDI